jgi:hypothetical protein
VRHGQPLTSDRVSEYVDGRLHYRQSAKVDWGGSLIEIGILDSDYRQVTIAADKLHLPNVLPGIVLLFDYDQSTVVHDVRVGQNPVAIDHKTRSDSDSDVTRIPGHPVIRVLRRRRNPNETLMNIGPRRFGNCATHDC